MTTHTTTHECPHPHCTRRVPQEMYACKPHWFQLPKGYRDEIWRTYRAGGGMEHLKAMQAAEQYYQDKLASS